MEQAIAKDWTYEFMNKRGMSEDQIEDALKTWMKEGIHGISVNAFLIGLLSFAFIRNYYFTDYCCHC